MNRVKSRGSSRFSHAPVALAACQLDVTVDVVVDPDGTGQIAVTVLADQDVLDQLPTLIDDLVLDDVIEAGWSVDGPRVPDDGSWRAVPSNDASVPLARRSNQSIAEPRPTFHTDGTWSWDQRRRHHEPTQRSIRSQRL